LHDENSSLIKLEEANINNWVLEPRTIGKNQDQTQFFIVVLITNRIGLLIKGYKAILIEEQLHLEIKITEIEHIRKIGIILGPNLWFAAKIVYETEMYNILKLEQRLLEIKKDFIYEKDYKSQCIIVFTILLNQEKMDHQLQQIKWLGSYTK